MSFKSSSITVIKQVTLLEIKEYCAILEIQSTLCIVCVCVRVVNLDVCI